MDWKGLERRSMAARMYRMGGRLRTTTLVGCAAIVAAAWAMRQWTGNEASLWVGEANVVMFWILWNEVASHRSASWWTRQMVRGAGAVVTVATVVMVCAGWQHGPAAKAGDPVLSIPLAAGAGILVYPVVVAQGRLIFTEEMEGWMRDTALVLVDQHRWLRGGLLMGAITWTGGALQEGAREAGAWLAWMVPTGGDAVAGALTTLLMLATWFEPKGKEGSRTAEKGIGRLQPATDSP